MTEGVQHKLTQSALNGLYGKWYKQQMDSFQPGLWQHLEAVPTLEPPTREAVMRYLLELACQAQNINNILLGRMTLLALPRDWLAQHIERYAEPLMEREDEWEYRRLAEIYEQLDFYLLLRHIERGQASPNSNIQEAAQDFLEGLERK